MSVWRSKDINTACALGCTGVKDRCLFSSSYVAVSWSKRMYRGVYLLPVFDMFSYGNGSYVHEDMCEQLYLPGMYVARTDDAFSTGDGSVAVWVSGTWVYV